MSESTSAGRLHKDPVAIFSGDRPYYFEMHLTAGYQFNSRSDGRTFMDGFDANTYAEEQTLEAAGEKIYGWQTFRTFSYSLIPVLGLFGENHSPGTRLIPAV